MGGNNGCGVLPTYGFGFEQFFPNVYGPRDMSTTEPAGPTVAEEVAELRKQVEELVYWMRPMTGNLVTGKAAVEEYKRLMEGAKP